MPFFSGYIADVKYSGKVHQLHAPSVPIPHHKPVDVAHNPGPVYGRHAPKPVYHDVPKPAVVVQHKPLYQIPRLPPPPVHHFL